jgi:predicted AlkP superfamily phosphohydrolase/phosphomutase
MTRKPKLKVVVLGLDGFDPLLAEQLMAAGRLPNLSALRARGGYTRLETTTPAQTPVAWSTFATGVNPGGHGIYDFLRRDPETYLPELALNRYEQQGALVPPKVVNLRRGNPVWSVLGRAGVPSVILRCPCTYPPDALTGRMLSGMGVPDLRGGLGTGTFYTTDRMAAVGESEQVIELVAMGAPHSFSTRVLGPRDPRTRGDVAAEIEVHVDRSARRVRIESPGRPKAVEVEAGRWSDWVRFRFRSGLLQVTSGMVRFLLVRTEPHLELYASPVNFDPAAPPFPISHPWDYANELARRLGLFHTTGMIEDHAGLTNGRLDEAAFLAQCHGLMREREQMLRYELERMEEGLLFCLFDTPDRLQHMFWRFREPAHPANREHPPGSPELAGVIEEHYVDCDSLVGRVMHETDDSTLLIVLSDHGFTSFQRGFHVNTWLLDQGLLCLKEGVAAGDEAGEFLRHVDWGRTRAYALGLGSVYLNVAGREIEGIVPPDEAETLARHIAHGLSGLIDEERHTVAVRGARTREQVYHGPCAKESPDLVLDFAAGYRASWTTALGGVPARPFEDNVRKWGGDHLVDPCLVPGVLFMSRPLRDATASLLDLAPTMLTALGVPVPAPYEGTNLVAGA